MMRIVVALAIGLVLVCGAAVAPADLITTFDAHTAAVNALDLADDGTLFSGGKDGRIKRWDLNSYEPLMDVMACQVGINDLEVDPLGGSLLAVAGNDGWVKAWDAQTMELLSIMEAHDGPANCVAIGMEGTRIFTGGDDGYLRVWNVENDYILEWEVHANFGGVNDLVFMEDEETGDNYIFTCGVDGMIVGYTAEDGILLGSIQAFDSGEALCMAFSSDQMCLVAGGSNGEIHSFDGFTGSLTHTIRAHAGDVNYVGFSDDESLVVSGGADGKVKLWNRDGEFAGDIQAHVLAVRDIEMSIDMLVTGGADFKVRVWDSKF